MTDAGRNGWSGRLICYNKNVGFILEEVRLALFCTQSFIVSHVR